MTTQASERTGNSSLNTGATLVAIAGLGMVGYGFVILLRNGNGFTEPGLSVEQLGKTPDQIQAFSQDLYNYILHVQAGSAGFMIGLGVAVIALALFGIRRGESWALWTACLSSIVALAVALPLHYPFHFDTLEHLGPAYLMLLILLVGTFLSWRAIRAAS